MPHGYWPVISLPAGLTLSWCAGWCSWNLLEKHFNLSRKRDAEEVAAAPEPSGVILARELSWQ
jgi:hypothetical protein